MLKSEEMRVARDLINRFGLDNDFTVNSLKSAVSAYEWEVDKEEAPRLDCLSSAIRSLCGALIQQRFGARKVPPELVLQRA